MTILDRLAPWATTGVGSLPHAGAGEAVDHVLTGYDVPFCPQLPRLEGDMITEWLGADPGRCGWSPGRDRERPRAWDDFLRGLALRPPVHGVVKLQVTGPVTLACALVRSGGGAPSRSEAIGLAGELSAWLAAGASARATTLARRGLDVVLVVDEPALGAFGTDGLETVWEPLRGAAAAWGLHLCCAVPWRLVDRVEPDVLSFDLTLAPLDDDAVGSLTRLVARGAHIAWGALSAHREEDARHAFARLREALSHVPGAGERSLLTPACGTGRMSVEREREVALALRRVGAALRGVGSPPAACHPSPSAWPTSSTSATSRSSPTSTTGSRRSPTASSS